MGTLLFKILAAVFVLVASCDGTAGVNCINCSDDQKCNEGVSREPILSCKDGVECNDVLLKNCPTKLNCYALTDCTETGVFPDPEAESNYFMCVPDSGSGFIKLMFTCPQGEYFDQGALMCVPSAATMETTLPPTTESTTPIPPTTTPTPPPATEPPPFACTAAGLFPNPTNCKAYFRCSTSLKVFPYICPGRSYFNEIILKCSMILTPTCQEQILQNTTTLTTGITTPTTKITTSAPVPSSTTPAPTTGPTTSSPFACMAPGIFSNPTNCKMYYHCSSSLKAFYYICPGNSYFNEITRKCSMIITPTCQEQILRNNTTPTTITTPSTSPTTTTPTTTPETTTNPTTSSTPTTTPETTTNPTTPSTPTTTPETTTNPTTPSTPTTTPETTTNPTTPSTPTTTPETTTNPTTPFSKSLPGQFSCLSSGTFENPTSCKTYYRCSSTRKAFLFTCPGSSYFNEYTKRCSMVITARCKTKLLS